MPNGKTHDAVTIVLALPVLAAAFLLTKNVWASILVCGAFGFGGLMFGPDLDTVSRQFSRWWILKPLWLPYRLIFKHRSRWSHGLVFGALFRVIYFLGILTAGSFAAVYTIALYHGAEPPGLAGFLGEWKTFGTFARSLFGEHVFLLFFAGLWLGAASHTFTDIAGTFIKTGRLAQFH
jgi:uncharacterized metal-binding protein